MSDAMTDGYRMEREGDAKDAFLQKLIEYLSAKNPPSPESFKTEIEAICRKNGVNFEKTFSETFDRIINNDPTAWKEVADHEEQNYFRLNPGERERFYAAAQQRKIGNLQWVI